MVVWWWEEKKKRGGGGGKKKRGRWCGGVFCVECFVFQKKGVKRTEYFLVFARFL